MRDLFAIVVHTLVFDDERRLLLLRRASTGFMDGHYAPPGGHKRAGESVVGAAIRECREEAGIDVVEARPLVAMPYPGEPDGVDFIFEAVEWSGEARIGEPAKCDDLLFAATGELPNNTVPFVQAALECRADDVWFREFE